ncbi:MAG: aminopeptidase N [Gammaproteobacteria bacterium]|nr:aminopeptidase N [Gammaproteobacteria bacterium]
MDTAAEKQPVTVRLEDYRPPDYVVDEVDLLFRLDPGATRVHARLKCRRAGAHDRPLRLDGEDLELSRVLLDGRELAADDYRLTDDSLTIPAPGDAFELEIETVIHPDRNTELSGLYISSGNFCTQCEAEGFRRITYFPDRPDVLATYTTTMVAEADRFPVMLSNGNLVESASIEGGMRRVVWHDPHPKPSYLFALVAGDLACIEDRFTTMGGKPVDLYVYTQHHNIDKCGHAMRALKNAMRWDEEQYGREYDLERFHIVAVDDFNMGAMENKGLNIFNSQYVLARPDTATDADYENIEGIVGHEYLHNWSGNRVTCRDWFQLSLKEGFTVFRDQQFSADMGSAGVKRIQDVNVLRTLQFREDSGPMAHPVRPGSYQEINNFYTVTVYNKGAEVVRMLHHLLGPEGFRRGTDLYFDRHDGQAVTTEEFVKALEDANDADLSRFRLWYDQAGTPAITVAEDYDAETGRYTLTLSQHTPDTPGQTDKKPFHIPVDAALLDSTGRAMPVWPEGAESGVLALQEASQTYDFEVDEKPVPSLLRGFSAPVRLEIDRPADDWYFLMTHDTDPFVRWDAGQQMATTILTTLVTDIQSGRAPDVPEHFVSAFRRVLIDGEGDRQFQAEMLRLPGEGYLAESFEVIDPEAISRARHTLKKTLASRLEADILARYHAIETGGEYRPESRQIGARALRNCCLSYLVALDTAGNRALAAAQFEAADNMTDRLAALQSLAGTDSVERDRALESFHEEWQSEPLIINKWLSVQATSPASDTLERVLALAEHPAFDVRNPNKVRALIGAFAQGNPLHFHRPDGKGYELVGDYVLELDRLNPQVAARLASPFSFWRHYEATRRDLMRAQLERIRRSGGLSRDVGEIVSKALDA